MAERRPFVLLDDARESGAADALLFENPQRTFVAYRADQVADVLAAADAARREGGELAGYIAMRRGSRSNPGWRRLPTAASVGKARWSGWGYSTSPCGSRPAPCPPFGTDR